MIKFCKISNIISLLCLLLEIVNGYNFLDVIVCLSVIGISIYLRFACVILQSAEWLIVLRDLHLIRVYLSIDLNLNCIVLCVNL